MTKVLTLLQVPWGWERECGYSPPIRLWGYWNIGAPCLKWKAIKMLGVNKNLTMGQTRKTPSTKVEKEKQEEKERKK